VPVKETKAAARRFYEVLNHALATGDLGALDEVLAPHAVDDNPTPGQASGRDGIKRAFGEFRLAFPDLRLTVEDMIAEGDKVVCRIRTDATHRGAFQGVPPTGKRVTQTGIDILRFAGDRLVERWGEFDTLGLLQQLGIAPPPR
jgi:steroid delta-isomerase-like uncharacterized protein